MHPRPPSVARRLPGPEPVPAPARTVALRRAVVCGGYRPPIDHVAEAVLAWLVRAPDLAADALRSS